MPVKVAYSYCLSCERVFYWMRDASGQSAQVLRDSIDWKAIQWTDEPPLRPIDPPYSVPLYDPEAGHEKHTCPPTRKTAPPPKVTDHFGAQRDFARKKEPGEDQSLPRPRQPTAENYRTLGLEPGATPVQIKRAYRKLSRRFHPDLQGKEASEERMKAINVAYEQLLLASSR